MTGVADERSSTDPLLSVRALSTYFPTSRGLLHAVESVSFELSRGETLGVVGESGSGKSVLARSVMRLLPSSAMTSGEVCFEGDDVGALTGERLRALWGRRMSLVFQDPMTALNPVHRIGRQLGEVLRLHRGLRGADARRRATELLAQVGIPEPERRLRSYPSELSGGMRQRVCIALAMSCSPSMMFADEPTTALDVTIQRQVLDVLTAMQADTGMAMVLITHDLALVAGRTDSVMVMYGGRVVESGPTLSLFSEMRHPYTVSLLGSLPRLRHRSHTRLSVIPGRPADVIDPVPGCRFAPRCAHAQERCVREDPPLTTRSNSSHRYACFYPVGTPHGDAAREQNLVTGRTAAGLVLRSTEVDAI